jgi:hypothetical protein
MTEISARQNRAIVKNRASFCIFGVAGEKKNLVEH